jgi:hypothetical protein
MAQGLREAARIGLPLSLKQAASSLGFQITRTFTRGCPETWTQH